VGVLFHPLLISPHTTRILDFISSPQPPCRHIVDDPAWPQVSTTYPNFTRGAYASPAIYTPSDQAHLKQYAWERGIMILFELDVPGHCASWGAGNPNYVVEADGHQTLINPVGEVGQPGTIYEVIANLLVEFAGRFGSSTLPFAHLGGDEVTDYTAWLTSPAVRSWATQLGLNPDDPRAIRTAFTTRIQQVARNAGLRPMMWEESYNGRFNVSKDTIVTPWVTPDVVGNATAAGHDVIVYVGYYLDQWVPPARTNGWYNASVDYAYVDSLNLLYTFDPITSTGVAPQDAAHVLGGVASAWGDNVDTSLGATTMLYPRGLAVGEKLWSPQAFTAITDPSADELDDVQTRLEHARCKLVQRGIGASPIGVAGDYGLCWRPEWGGVSPTPAPIPSTDDVSFSSGGVAGLILGSAAAGGIALVLAFHGSEVVRAAGALVAKADTDGAQPATSSDGSARGSSSAGPRVAASFTSSSSSSSPPSLSPASSQPAARVVALDQLRGATMFAMLFVNLYYGYSMLPPFFSHGITYFSGPDLIEPLFHFCVGFALRLVLLKRLGAAARGQQEGWGLGEIRSWSSFWAPRLRVFVPLFRTRVVGLIVLSMFFTEGWGQYQSWSGIDGFGDWIARLVRDNQPYHTLLHIAFITVWTYVPMTLGWRVRAAQMAVTTAIHILLHATFYFRWIKDYDLDEGGYFGFFGWAVEALTGSVVHDIVAWAASEDGDGKGTRAKTGAGDEGDSAKRPLLADGHEVVAVSSPSRAAAVNAGPGAKPLLSQRRQGGGEGVWRHNPRASTALRRVALVALGLMVVGYLLSCLGAVAPTTLCYDGTRIFFWGGFGNVVPCSGVPTYGGGFLVAPPFYLPDPAKNVVTMWTMTQRAGSPTYHIFAAGTSSAFFALFYALCEIGIRAPAWWQRVEGLGARVLGVRAARMDGEQGADADGEEVLLREGGAGNDGAGAGEAGAPYSRRLLVRWHVAEVFGENALAVYLIGDAISDNVGSMLPQDCPAWYFLLWGEGLYLGVSYVAAAYLRAHKLFLRL
jgi:hypothetical protein